MNKKSYIIFLLILGLGIFLRIYKLGEPSIWIDEAFSFWVVNGNLASVIKKITFDAHPPLYFILLHFWIYLGQTEFILRSLSVIFGIGTLVLIYFFAKDCLQDKRLGLIASFLYAVSFFSIIHIDTDVKMYSLLAFLSLLSLYLLIKALQTSKSYFWWLYGFATLLSLYTHYYSFFVFFAQILYLAWLYFIKKHKNIQLKWAVLLLLYLPWLKVFIYQSMVRKGGEFLPRIYFLSLYYVFYIFNGLSLICTVEWIVFLVFLLFGYFAIRGAVNIFKRDKFSSALLFQFIITIIIPFFIAYFTSKHIFQARYLSAIFPLYILLIANGISSIKKEKIKFFVILLFVIINICSFGRYYSSPYYQKQDWGSVVKYIEEKSEPGDALCFHRTYNVFPFNHYYKKRLFKIELSPERDRYFLIAGKKYIQEGGLYQYGLDELDFKKIRQIVKTHRRVWLILCGAESSDPEMKALKWFEKNCNFKGGVATKNFRAGQSIISIGLFERK